MSLARWVEFCQKKRGKSLSCRTGKNTTFNRKSYWFYYFEICISGEIWDVLAADLHCIILHKILSLPNYAFSPHISYGSRSWRVPMNVFALRHGNCKHCLLLRWVTITSQWGFKSTAAARIVTSGCFVWFVAGRMSILNISSYQRPCQYGSTSIPADSSSGTMLQVGMCLVQARSY